MRFFRPFIWILMTGALSAQIFTVNQILEIADQNHPEILQSRAAWNAAQANIRTALSPADPVFFAEAEGVPKGESWRNHKENKVGITQSIQFPTTWWLNAKAARYEASKAQADYLLTRQNVLADVKKQAWQILRLQQQMDLLDSLTAFSEQILRSARVRVRSGESPLLDSLKAAVESISARNAKLSAEAELKNAGHSLFNLLNLKSDTVIDGDLSVAIHALWLPVMSENHPALQKERAHLNVRKTAKAGAISSLLPDFHIKYVRVTLPEDPTPNRWTGEIGLSLPLWAWLGNQGKIRSADFEVQAAEWQLRAVEKALQSKLKKAHSEVRLAGQRIRNFETGMLKQSEELLRIATRSYEVGETDLITLMNARTTWFQTQMQYLEAFYTYRAALADYETVAGGDPMKPGNGWRE